MKGFINTNFSSAFPHLRASLKNGDEVLEFKGNTYGAIKENFLAVHKPSNEKKVYQVPADSITWEEEPVVKTEA